MNYVWILQEFNIEVVKKNSDAKKYELKLKKIHFASRIMQKLVPYLEVKIYVPYKLVFMCYPWQNGSCENCTSKDPRGQQNDF
jgi:hypothetical protein